jgi:hypothetical protein
MLKTARLGSLILITVLLLLGSKPANADTSVSNPNDGFGGSYTLAVTACGVGGCTVTLTINTAALTNPSKTAYIDAVAFKLGSGATFTGTLTAPSGATWTTSTTSLNSGHSGPCQSTNGDVQTCSAAGSPLIGVATGGTLMWTWTGVQGTDTNISHVGYQYNNGTATTASQLNGLIVSCGYDSNGNTSCGGTPPGVSEPGSLAILGIGMVGLAGLLRRRGVAHN